MTIEELIAIANKELNRRKKISATKTGGKHSEETRQKMKDAHARRFANMKKTVNAQTGLEGRE